MGERLAPTVKDLIVERIRSGDKPEKRKDPYKLGAVIVGGGMAGVVAAGEVTALQSMNALPAFDSIYSNSSGDCAAKYWLAGQTPAGTSIYYEDINNTRFIDRRRLFGPEAIMNVSYLINVMKISKKLDTEKVANSEQKTHTYLASAKDATTVDITHYSKSDEVFDAISWTIRIPVVAGMPVRVGNDFYMDGATFISSVPFLEAVKDGCTHIAVLLSRPMGDLKEKRHLFELYMVARLRRDFPEAAKHFNDRPKRYEANLRKIRDIQTGKSHEVEVKVFEPNLRIHTLETRRDVLVAGAKEGYRAVEQAFNGSGVIFDRSVKIKTPFR